MVALKSFKYISFSIAKIEFETLFVKIRAGITSVGESGKNRKS